MFSFKPKISVMSYLACDIDYFLLTLRYGDKEVCRKEVLDYVVIQGINNALNSLIVKYLDKEISETCFDFYLTIFEDRTKFLVDISNKLFKYKSRNKSINSVGDFLVPVINKEYNSIKELRTKGLNIDCVKQLNSISKSLSRKLDFVIYFEKDINKDDVLKYVDDYYSLVTALIA